MYFKSKIFKMFAIELVFALFLSPFVEAVDPELDLCSDLSIDAAVSADDGIDYIIKGDFYWQFSTNSGISPYFIGRPISERWPGLSGPIDAAFAIDEPKYRFSTVFIKNNSWFLYKQNVLKKNGSTDNWPSFPKYKIDGAFDYRFNKSMERKEYPIIFIYNKDKYLRYIIQNIDRPKLMAAGRAFRMGIYFYFLETDEDADTKPISDYIDVKAIISNSNDLIFFGNKQFCWANVSISAPPCFRNDIKNVSKFFGCPRNPYPTSTTTTRSTKGETELYLSTNSEFGTKTSNSSKKSTQLTTKRMRSTSLLPSNAAAVEEVTAKTSSDWTLTIVIIVTIFIIILISCSVIVFVIKRKKNNKISLKKSENKKSLKRTPSSESLGAALKLSDSPLIDNKTDDKNEYMNKDLPKNKSLVDKSEGMKPNDSFIDDYPNSEQLEDADEDSKTALYEADQLLTQIKANNDLQD